MPTGKHLDRVIKKTTPDQAQELSHYGLFVPTTELHARLSVNYLQRGNDKSNVHLSPEQRAELLKRKHEEMTSATFSYKGKDTVVDYVFARPMLDESVVKRTGPFQVRIRVNGGRTCYTVDTDKLIRVKGEGLKESA